MKLDVVLTIVRQILLSVGAVFVTKGTIDNETMLSIVGGVVGVVTVVWGIFAKSKDVAKVEAAQTVLSQSDPGVTKQEVARAAAQIQK